MKINILLYVHKIDRDRNEYGNDLPSKQMLLKDDTPFFEKCSQKLE